MSKTQEKKRARGSSSTVEEDVTDKMILEKLSNIHADVKGSKDELKSEIQALKSELSEVTKSLNAVLDEVQSLKQKNKDIQDQCDAAAMENSKLNEEISTLKNQVIKLEDYSRRENLRFYNIPENPGESSVECSRKVMDVLSELGADLENIKFHAIHRTGKPDTSASSNNAVSNGVLTESRERASRTPRPRPILVRFVSRMDSDWAWENRKKLMNSSRFSSVFIDKDLSAESAKQRGKLRAAFRKAKELNIGKVFIKVVSVRENLPDNKDFNNAETSSVVDGKGAEGGYERKRSITGPILRRLSSISNDYEPLPAEDPDQSVEAGGPQRKRSRSNSLMNALRKSSIHAVKEENSIQPSGKSWPPKEVTIKLFPNSPEIPQAGSRVKFQCTVRGCQQDLVFYRWFKDEQELQGEANSTLILDPLKVQDFGSYRCEVRSVKRDDSSCVESAVVELDVTPAEGKSYRKLAEVFENNLNLKETVANLLQKETNVCRKAYKHVACYYKMTDIADQLERCKNPGEDVLDSLKSTQPDLTVHHFCKVLKGENIRRLDIVNKLVDYLI